MGEKLRLDLDIATREAQSNLRAAAREAKALGTDIDDARTEGQKFADSLRMVTDNAAADFAQAQAAAEKLGAALGDELVAELKQAGGSVEGLVADLKKAGLTYQDIEADAKSLGDALQHANDVNKSFGTDIDARARVASDGLDRVRSSADQSGSVLANMVGNSVQDLGALGGIAGTAGMALGQLGEYATEGNISMSSLAKVAGPMAGITVAVTGITWAIGKMKEESKRAAEAQKEMLKVQEALRDGQFDQAAIDMQEAWKGTISELEELGFTTEEVIGHMTGQSSIMDELGVILEANTIKFAEGGVGLTEYGAHVNDVIGNLNLASGAFKEAGTELDNTETQTNAIEGALRVLYGTTGRAAEGFGKVDRSAQDFSEEVGRAEQATRDLDDAYSALTGKLDQQDAWADLQVKMWEYHANVNRSDQDTRDYIRSLGEMVDGLVGVPAETKADLIAQLDDGDIAVVESYLNTWAKGVNVPVNFKGVGQVGFMKNATGTTPSGVPEAGISIVGENGPEAVWLPKNANVASASKTAGMGGSTSVTNVYNQTIYTPAAINPSDVARAQRKWSRDHAR